jgi:DNA-binding CsgD family transcriptional regulator
MGQAENRQTELLDVLASGEPAAFATDSRERIVFWNDGAAALLGRRADEVMGRHCYEVLGGRDLFGNRFCYANCPLAAMTRMGEAPHPFEVRVPGRDRDQGSSILHVTIVRLPGPRPDLFTLAHIIHGVDEEGRLARTLARLGPRAAGAVPATAGEGVAAATGDTVPGAALTAREREILGWMAAGLQNKDIAQRLDISLATVRNHIHNTLEKLDVHSKLEAVSMAYRNGWVGVAGGNGAASTPHEMAREPR